MLFTFSEALRFIGMPSSIAANMRQIFYGAALVACMMWRPQGLMGKYAFGILSRGLRSDVRRLKTEEGGQRAD